MVGEHYLRFYRRDRGLDFTALRYGNVYGPRQDPNGEAGRDLNFHREFSRAPSRCASIGTANRRATTSSSPTSQQRTSPRSSAAPGESYVIGTGIKTSVNEIYRALVRISGFEAPIEHAAQRPGDARDAQFDAARARAELGWTPSTSLTEGIRATYEYFEHLPPA